MPVKIYKKNSDLIENGMVSIKNRHPPGSEIILAISVLTLTKSSLLNSDIPEEVSPIAPPKWKTLPLSGIG